MKGVLLFFLVKSRGDQTFDSLARCQNFNLILVWSNTELPYNFRCCFDINPFGAGNWDFPTLSVNTFRRSF